MFNLLLTYFFDSNMMVQGRNGVYFSTAGLGSSESSNL